MIIGAGVVGLCTAHELAARGFDVVVVDKERIHNGASVGNAGLLTFNHRPINRPGLGREAIGWALHRRGPVYIAPRADRELASWLWTFFQHCTEERVAHAWAALSALGSLSRPRWHHLHTAIGTDCAWREVGWLEVCRTAHGLEEACAEAEAGEPYGHLWQRLSPAELRATSTAWRDGLAGAVHHPNHCCLDPGLFMRAFARLLAANGVRIDTRSEVTRLMTQRGRVVGVEIDGCEAHRVDLVVVAAGAWTPALLATVGVDLPLQPARGYHRDMHRYPHPLPMGSILRESYVAATPMGPLTRLAGTLEFSGLDRPWLHERLEQLTESASAYLRDLPQAELVHDWAGYRPCTPDGVPVISGIDGLDGLIVATGHGMLGLTMAPGTAALVGELAEGRHASPLLHAFRHGRFWDRQPLTTPPMPPADTAYR